MIVVQKRINTRVYTGKSTMVDNPPPGTIVDSVINRRHWSEIAVLFLFPV